MSKESEAVKEVAIATQKGIDASEKLGGFLSKVFGEGLIHLGQAFSDKAQLYRFKNLLKVSDQVEAICEARKLQGKCTPIPPRFALPILESASMEDDPELKKMWAGMIANSMDPNHEFSPTKLFIQILSSLDPLDVEILAYLNNLDGETQWPLRQIKGVRENSAKIASELKRDENECLVSLSNLARNNLIKDGWEQSIESLDFGYSGFSVDNRQSDFRLSYLGLQLLRACAT